jgi:predicted Zn-dependent peptidase
MYRIAGNSGMAAMLGLFQANYGDWRRLFTIADQMNRVSADDLQRVLLKYFVLSSRTTVHTAMASQPETALAGDKQ